MANAARQLNLALMFTDSKHTLHNYTNYILKIQSLQEIPSYGQLATMAWRDTRQPIT